jgi:cytoskeletal protein RodZ
MALSQDEQRVLAEIERRLAADDPGLASCLTTFRRPGPATVLRSPRARIIGSLFTVLLVAMVALMVYAMIPFRTQHLPRPTPPTTAGATANTAGAPGNTTMSATTTQPNGTQQSSASVNSTTSQSATNRPVASTATGGPHQAGVKPTNTAIFPAASP